MPSQSTPLTERKYALPFALVTSLFFLWSIGVNLNDVLIPHLKKAFDLTDFQSSFIQIAFFGGYFLAAFPAGRLMEKIGYKKGLLLGLLICATELCCFFPPRLSAPTGFSFSRSSSCPRDNRFSKSVRIHTLPFSVRQ